MTVYGRRLLATTVRRSASGLVWAVVALLAAGCATTGSEFPAQPRLTTLVASPPDYSTYAARRETDRALAQQNGFSLDGSFRAASELSETGRIDDPKLTDALAKFNARLVPESIPNSPIRNFYVSGSPDFNADALETGDIVVARGATQAEYADQLAFLLGHESAHILSDHFKDREKRDRTNQLLSGLLTIAVIADYFATGGVMSSAGKLAVYAAFGAVTINEAGAAAWAIKQEQAADQLGLELIVAKDYSPLGAISVLEKIRNTEKEQKERLDAAFEARCGKRMSFGDQFAKSAMRGLAGQTALSQADRDPVCQRWNDVTLQLFQPKTMPSEQRLQSMQSYVTFRYPELKSQKSMLEFKSKAGKPTTFVDQVSPGGQVQRAILADEVTKLVEEGKIEQARPLTRRLVNKDDPNDPMPAARWALYIFGRATNDPNAIRHLEIAADANTANVKMLRALYNEYEARKNYEAALRTVRRLQSRNTERVAEEFPAEIRYLRLLGRTSEIPAVIEKCKKTKIKPLASACEKEATATEETPAAEPIKQALSFNVFAAAVSTTELAALLDRPAGYTIYAPTNAALAERFGGDPRAALAPENRAALRQVVLSQIRPGRPTADGVVRHANEAPPATDPLLALEAVGGSAIGFPIETRDATIIVVDTLFPEAATNRH